MAERAEGGDELRGGKGIRWWWNNYLFIYLFMPPALNPKSHGKARVLEAPSGPMLVIERSFCRKFVKRNAVLRWSPLRSRKSEEEFVKYIVILRWSSL